ncbi:unnamed protein product [Cercopithifilaria johnstoni]|uniref:Uncharacterized protein n=1 Tax=Cercopithifilaria johnstoni TaxID=2874296 RepID=A0A8J2Q1S7_9BILA|nr:unnamed protein product [Cercopithifilaria johnstoni]
MTQIPAKKSTVHQGTPSVKKKNSRRSSRSRSRGRHSRRSTPPRSLASQTVKTDSAEKILPAPVRRSVVNAVKEDSTPLENHSLQAPMKSYGTVFGMEKPMRLSSYLIDHPYILTFIHLLMCVLYAFIIYKVVNFFGVDRFVMKHWAQWSKKIRSNLSP